MTPNFPDTANIYSVSANEWGSETATLEFVVSCIIEPTNTHSQADAVDSGEGAATMFCLKQGTDIDGKLVAHSGRWYRVVSEFEPRRSIFTNQINHIEVSLQDVQAPEVVA